MPVKVFPGGNGIRFMPVHGMKRMESRAEGGGEPARFEVAFSSEAEVDRMGFFGNWREVLGHGPGEVQMGRFESGRASMLEEHQGPPIGVIETASIDRDRMGRAVVRTSRTSRGTDAAMDMEDGTRGNISVGYIPKRARLIEENTEKGDLWRVTLWEPVELSLVGVPADESVGVGRSVQQGYPPVETEAGETVVATEEGVEMKKKRVLDERGIEIEVGEDDPRAAITERRAVVEVLDRDAERGAIRAEEVERSETIRALAEMNGLASVRADEAIRKGTSVVQFTRDVMNEKVTKPVSFPHSESLDGLSAKDRRSWSFIRAIRMGAGIAAREAGDDTDDFGRTKFDGVEAEVHRQLVKDMPAGVARRGGILIPMDMRTREERQEAAFLRENKRTLQAAIATKGAESVFDAPGEFIELLRSATMVAQAGARFLTGLSGPLGFVKQTGGVTVQWVGENPAADVPDSDLTLGIVTMAPKTLQASSAYTRQLLSQSSLEIEAMSRQEFAEAHARAIDKAAIHGKGAAGEPLGIYLAPGVSAFAMGGAPTFPKLISMETLVANQNALRGSTAWLTNPTIAGEMMSTPVLAAAGSEMIWQGPFEAGRMANYPAFASTQVSGTMLVNEELGGTSQGLIYGNWAEVMFGLYNTIEVVVDPYRLKKRGIIEVTSFQLADLILRHGESFAKATGAT